MLPDPSNGYDAVAHEFIRLREAANIGAATVLRWARSLPRGAKVLELGSGSGRPVTETLLQCGLEVAAVDASPSLVAVFRERYPHVPVTCEPVESSEFHRRRFDAAVAIGLVFLLPEEAQRHLMRRLPQALVPGARLLFSAPAERCRWIDALTARPSRSLGRETYLALLSEAGFGHVREYDDEGGNHYYDARLQERDDTPPTNP